MAGDTVRMPIKMARYYLRAFPFLLSGPAGLGSFRPVQGPSAPKGLHNAWPRFLQPARRWPLLTLPRLHDSYEGHADFRDC